MANSFEGVNHLSHLPSAAAFSAQRSASFFLHFCKSLANQEKRRDLVGNTNGTLGTWPYMAPEQARGQVQRVDQRSDVFGLGAVLCEILGGQPPYSPSSAKTPQDQAKDADLHDAFARLDLEQQVRSCFTVERHKGQFTREKQEQIFELKLKNEEVVVLDLWAAAFKGNVRVEDASGKVFAQQGLTREESNYRLVFTATHDGIYRIVTNLSSRFDHQPFDLTIGIFAGRK